MATDPIEIILDATVPRDPGCRPIGPRILAVHPDHFASAQRLAEHVPQFFQLVQESPAWFQFAMELPAFLRS